MTGSGDEASKGTMVCIAGWDVGAANIKAAMIQLENQAEEVRFVSRPFEIWRQKDHLTDVLRCLLGLITKGTQPQAMAVTMTAELSDVFVTKREGVLYVLESMRACFPSVPIFVFSLLGQFVPFEEALSRPLDFAASNWLACASWVARQYPNCLLVDVGSTTTDIVPIINGQVRASGRTDLDRLSSGELVYTGLLRTNLAATIQSVPVAGRFCRVASEYFAIAGDVHLILGHLVPQDYTCTTPDGLPPTIDSARRRIARLVCADAEMLSTSEIDDMARYICARQILQIREALEQVISRFPCLQSGPLVLLGSGAFLGEAAAAGTGLQMIEGAAYFGEGSAVAPSIAAAHLLADYLRAEAK